MTAAPGARRPRVYDGLRVVEMSRFSPVAFASVVLADLGADVIKVEPTLASGVGGTAVSPSADERAGQSSSWINRNKRSLTLDHRTPEGQEVLLDLVRTADVLIEGFRPGGLEKYGLDHAGLSAVNPGIVMCSLSSYGQDGPYRDVLGHDLNYLSAAGVLDLLGTPGEPGIPLNLVADLAGGALFAVISILGALHARQHTGHGQHLDLSYLDGTVAMLGATSVLKPALTAGSRPRFGAGLHSGRYPYYTTYACRDGNGIAVGCAETSTWHALCAALGAPDLVAAGPAAADRTAEPREHHVQARKRLAEIFVEQDRDVWFERLARVPTCISKVNRVDEIAADPQLVHRGMIVRSAPSASAPAQLDIGSPLHVRGDGEADPLPAPYRGEHTDEILTALGYADRLDALRDRGVV
jgi:crotonobetainyl-CoA:carnitine CoA-transferase CaiB-like acyl-CoA transferase